MMLAFNFLVAEAKIGFVVCGLAHSGRSGVIAGMNSGRKRPMKRPFELYDLRVTVERIEGRSVCGMAVGDYFELTESSKLRIPPGKHFCIYALSSVLPLLAAKQRELAENDWLTYDSVAACPDVDERLIMRVERVKKRTMDSDELT